MLSAILRTGSNMLVEQRGYAEVHHFMENFETNDPEILPVEKVRVLIPYDPELARYNAAVIKSSKNPSDILILLREVPLSQRKSGIPDMGNLLIYRSTPERVERVAQIDLKNTDIINWEDARAFTDEVSEEVLIGLTAIRAGDNKPVAATVRGRLVDDNFSIDQQSLAVYRNDEGKNVTPISMDKFLFRREGARHSLELISGATDENGEPQLKVEKVLSFPKKPWCEWQIGTQAQILPENILPIHGVNRFSIGTDNKTGEETFGYTYSLGLAQLDEHLNVIKVADSPLFTRESFKNILPMGREMDPTKNVIYCCGYSIKGDKVNFVVNIGDLMTVEVTKSMSDLRKILVRSSSILTKSL